MKQYSLSELVKRWEREDLTTEQAVGQILLWLVALSQRMDKLDTPGSKGQAATSTGYGKSGTL